MGVAEREPAVVLVAGEEDREPDGLRILEIGFLSSAAAEVARGGERPGDAGLLPGKACGSGGLSEAPSSWGT